MTAQLVQSASCIWPAAVQTRIHLPQFTTLPLNAYLGRRLPIPQVIWAHASCLTCILGVLPHHAPEQAAGRLLLSLLVQQRGLPQAVPCTLSMLSQLWAACPRI